MPNNRRTFIKNTAFTMAGTMLLSNSLAAMAGKKKITGVQLYSVRDDMKNDPLGTLKALRKMGYKNLEHANYVNRKFYGWEAKEFKKILDDLDMKMVSGHTVMRSQHWDATAKDFTPEWKYTVEDAAVLKQEYVISPWMDKALRENYDDLMRFMELFNKSGELCQQYGMKYGYHNHDFEFNTMLQGKSLYDLILQNTDPKLVIQQLDIGNMYSAGGRALTILQQYPGRFVSLHVKDEIKSAANADRYESTVLGKGVIDVKKVIDEARKVGGTEHFIIEQEAYQGQKPLDAVKEDLKMMKKWGY